MNEQEVMSVFKGLLGQKENFISKIAELEVELGEYRCVVARGASVVVGLRSCGTRGCERCHLSHVFPASPPQARCGDAQAA